MLHDRLSDHRLGRALVALMLVAGAGVSCGSASDTLSADLDITDAAATSVSSQEQSVDNAEIDDAAMGDAATDEASNGEANPATPTAAAVAATPTAAAAAEPAALIRPVAPNGHRAPAVATTALELADQIAAAELGLRDPATTADRRSDLGHLHQVAIRRLGYEPAWDTTVFEALPPELVEVTLLHVSARRALIDLHSGYDAADFIPAWAIVEPAPIDELLAHYQRAEAATGIEWEYLAAINLIETGMGRIRGLSSAGAQGPMQFLPTTWAEAGIGEGDINDPGDAIAAAARYLVRRGGPSDMAGAIWGYNNSDSYVTAVQAYAELLRTDPDELATIYNWEIYFFTDQGDIWLPTEFSSPEVQSVIDYIAANPWSAPDYGIRPPRN